MSHSFYVPNPTVGIAQTTALFHTRGGITTGMRNSSLGPSDGIDPTAYCSISGRSSGLCPAPAFSERITHSFLFLC